MITRFKSPFDDDPFFSMHQERLGGGVDGIFSSFFDHDPFLALTDGSQQTQRRHGSRDRGQGQSHDQDFDGSMDLMMDRDPFQSMMRNMNNMMGGLSLKMMLKDLSLLSQHHVVLYIHRLWRVIDVELYKFANYYNYIYKNEIPNDPNANVYSQSTVMSYSNVGNGQPKVYQATTATRQMPGGLRETRKAVRDSEAGLEKMAIGRHINDRGNVIARQRNARTGDIDENRDYFNMAQEDEPQFESEWQEKANNYYTNFGRNAIGQQRDRNRGTTSDETARTRHREEATPVAALESAPHRERQHQKKRHGKHK